MAAELSGKRFAVVFDQSELTEPRDALRHAGATVEVVSPKAGHIQA